MIKSTNVDPDVYRVTGPKWVNFSGAKAGMVRGNLVNTMTADALAPIVTMLSVAMLWTLFSITE